MASDPTRKSGAQNKLEGKAKEVGGRIKDAVGDLTGNPRHDIKGKADRVEGKLQSKLGDAQMDLDESRRRRDAEGL